MKIFLCVLLLLAQTGEPTPKSVPDRLPAVPVAAPSVGTPADDAAVKPVLPVSPNPAVNPSGVKQLRLQNGFLELPKRNHVVLAATERAVLMSLKTEQKEESGQPVMIPVAEGMNVVKGQVLGNFDDRELRSTQKINESQLEVAVAEKNKKIEIVYAAHGVMVAHAELQMMRDANRQHEKTFSEIEIRKAELAYEQTKANLDLQKYTIEEVKSREVTVRENELERTKVLIALRQLISPIDGMIVKINAAEGEWLREGDPVLEIVNLDTLLVRGNVSIKEYEISDMDGKTASVLVTLSNGKRETFEGKVVFCNPKVEAGNFFHIYIEVQNRRNGKFWLLQPGRGDVEIIIP
ncbi:MAG: HlyD family efflux transporter periplasmic adaptor subunit [Planctomycetaceae bacterium]|jgi:multidrug efflux pump subunit AcrA (membrane-fusion protein)|nr:HlyD family efflux transporter periplasmic adaptor subunit [Planctomycetaceae bacterium]